MTRPPILRIDMSSPVPAYRQIAGGIRAMLVAGDFAPGDLLPTIRQLAMDLGIHANTVAEAYRLLADEGWIDLRRRRGATVLEREPPEPAPGAVSGFAKRIEEVVAEAVAAGVPVSALTRHLQKIAGRIKPGEKPS